MRLFLGLDLPSEIKHQISDYLSPIQQSPKGWEHPNDYHQTLLFIGEASPQEEEEIKERLRHFSFHPFTLVPHEFKFFNRRVMFLSFQASIDLLELKNQVEHQFPEWSNRSTRSFLPHVTVKRWQRYEYDYLTKSLDERPFSLPPFLVTELCLFKAEKDSLNRKYHVIARKPFNS